MLILSIVGAILLVTIYTYILHVAIDFIKAYHYIKYNTNAIVPITRDMVGLVAIAIVFFISFTFILAYSFLGILA
jgi:hypothetical protein